MLEVLAGTGNLSSLLASTIQPPAWPLIPAALIFVTEHKASFSSEQEARDHGEGGRAS